MQSRPINALDFIKSQNYIEIPYYQRNYDWTKNNCERLMEDLYILHKDELPTHFFGSMVIKPGKLSSQSIVIDGQQRITTISLLILAIYNFIIEKNLESNYNLDLLYSNYLVNKQMRNQENIKLHSNPKDYEAYRLLFQDKKFYKQASNITKNYQYFYNELEKENIGVDDLIGSIEKLVLIEINLDSPQDDAQLIFESLNSTGLELSESDKIRNFLLMNENIEEQNDLYDKYWGPLEDLTSFQLDDFFRDYLTVRNSKYPNKSKVYEEFKKFFNNNYISKKIEFFEDLLDYGKTYQQINMMDTDSVELNYQLKRFVKLDVNVLKPFFMSIINDYNYDRLKQVDVLEILKVIETYIARRMITQQSSNALNKVFSVLYRDMSRILDKENQESSPANIISYLLLAKRGAAIFPDDEMVMQSFKDRNFYNINKNFRNFLFERLENRDTKEIIDIYGGLESGTFSIEHIMPQKLNSHWREELGINYKHIHDNYLNSIGNLTLTGYNSKYSNRSFTEKRNIANGFKDSNFKFLNSIPANSETWNEEKILKRIDAIIERALSIWEMPTSDYSHVVEVDDLITYIGEPSQFTGYKIKGYKFLDDEKYKEINTWVDMYVEVIKELYNIDPNPIIEAVEMNTKEGRLGNNFIKSPKKDKIGNYRKIDEGVYTFIALSNWEKFYIFNNLFPKYDIEYDALMLDAKE